LEIFQEQSILNNFATGPFRISEAGRDRQTYWHVGKQYFHGTSGSRARKIPHLPNILRPANHNCKYLQQKI